ncbi:bifunctional phosphopantothenoylcysteine decarboxylase/phosphopantothenate--cysteine ligase CoaBC [Saccharibacter sp. 17.LH.SD]|uniref:bifunctional phosphopantothenoylcysteine decarboxylase/phosphopantothenate--cysteine ligase CoaBC n=1 Tax=Saccharibacter sp. 17.LH.SD TaxID=2689393 RepID=UPI001367C891|nr:bifunctional phosphopantothenoylcysteine decarboxylase/phosphopantothenate--cysteine ligase CoaBC [Saccharibacter sp. 17.LH.SD]MXV44445.1 bifunctional phosphopantothenoylcysteine decarboxylase/phosphopantothenate--cysteine ligase CoaBC [Saccharibacter sp. 17.LH.SD]
MSRVLLIVSGGIAAYRALDVARLLRQQGMDVTPVMTEAAKEFITPLSLEVLCAELVHETLFEPAQESTIGHIALARAADLVLVCPATAHIMARMAQGLADDLATTLLLATTAPILLAPAMNWRMWEHPATQQNLALLRQRGVHLVGPDEGSMACGEQGVGRLSTPEAIVASVQHCLNPPQSLRGKRVLVTAGPTVEPLDPVRFLSNHSSGLQGYAVAEALAYYGAEVTLVSGPVSLPTPPRVTRIDVQTAVEMAQACEALLPVDVAVCVAAVSDWRPRSQATEKMKKQGDQPPTFELVENPDILATLSHHEQRPPLVIGFAAETENVLDHARAKRLRKGCDWLLANDVSQYAFGGQTNQVYLFDQEGYETWPVMDKKVLAMRLADKVSRYLTSDLFKE